ncbi:hypothetical protein ABT173_42355 [Streptomyces sp. NPDC001795]|uniref:hypothetical protein n=1 Tax=Streptomyces sp. NPDC001795 TaxID=3154525 RepID=UPI003323604C
MGERDDDRGEQRPADVAEFTDESGGAHDPTEPLGGDAHRHGRTRGDDTETGCPARDG